MRARFGPRVARIVRACTDADIRPKPPRRAREERYLQHLETEEPETLLIWCCDKPHNARAIFSDLRTQGEAVFGRFNAEGGDVVVLWLSRGSLFPPPAGCCVARRCGRGGRNAGAGQRQFLLDNRPGAVAELGGAQARQADRAAETPCTSGALVLRCQGARSDGLVKIRREVGLRIAPDPHTDAPLWDNRGPLDRHPRRTCDVRLET